MLRKLTIENYKIFSRAEINFRNINAIVGLNGSGKTNIFSAVRFLQSSIRTGSIVAAIEKSGAQTSNFFNLKRIHKEASFTLETENGGEIFKFFLRVRENQKKIEIAEEALTISTNGKEEMIYSRKDDSVYLKTDDSSAITINRDALVVAVYSDDAISRFKETVYKIYFLRPENAQEDGLAREGDFSLSGAIIKLKEKMPKEFADFQKIVSILVPSFATVVSIEGRAAIKNSSQQQDVEQEKDTKNYLVYFQEKSIEQFMSIKSQSFGDLKTFYIIAMLLAVREGVTLFIEEIENGVHPARLIALLDFMQKISHKRDAQVVMTSHSTDLINKLPAEEIIFVKRGNGGSEVVCLSSPDQAVKLKELLANGSTNLEFLSMQGY